MKLRIRDNSIRLRLAQSEVESLRSDGLVGGAVSFAGGSRLVYCLESSPACVDPVAHFESSELKVRVPESIVQQWATSDEVSIEAEQGLDEGGYLKILVEKDFACLAPREGEDESDMYRHPEEGSANC
jgi:hypothetical protein